MLPARRSKALARCTVLARQCKWEEMLAGAARSQAPSQVDLTWQATGLRDQAAPWTLPPAIRGTNRREQRVTVAFQGATWSRLAPSAVAWREPR